MNNETRHQHTGMTKRCQPILSHIGPLPVALGAKTGLNTHWICHIYILSGEKMYNKCHQGSKRLLNRKWFIFNYFSCTIWVIKGQTGSQLVIHNIDHLRNLWTDQNVLVARYLSNYEYRILNASAEMTIEDAQIFFSKSRRLTQIIHLPAVRQLL